jgi:hypothetical protein
MNLQGNLGSFKKTPRWKFQNALMLNLKTLEGTIQQKEVLEAIKLAFGGEELARISPIGQFGSNKIWVVDFKSDFEATKLVNKSIKLREKKFRFFDPNKQEDHDGKKTAGLRFIYLPSNIKRRTIQDFLSALNFKNLRVLEVTDEKYNEKGFENVSNGVITARIEYDVESDEAVQNLSGATSIFGLKAVIIIAGQRKRCHFCGDRSHIIRDCQIRKLQCDKCGLEGHHASKCNLAEKIKSIERSKIDYHDLEAVDEALLQLSAELVANEDPNSQLGFTSTLMDTDMATSTSTVAPVLTTNVLAAAVFVTAAAVFVTAATAPVTVAAVPATNLKASTVTQLGGAPVARAQPHKPRGGQHIPINSANMPNTNTPTVVAQPAAATAKAVAASASTTNVSTSNAHAVNPTIDSKKVSKSTSSNSTEKEYTSKKAPKNPSKPATIAQILNSTGEATTSGAATLKDSTVTVVNQDLAVAIFENKDPKSNPDVELMLDLCPSKSSSLTDLEQFMPADYQVSNDLAITAGLDSFDIYPKIGNSAPGAAKDFSSLRFLIQTDSILSAKPIAHDLLGSAVAARMAEHPMASTWKPPISKTTNSSKELIQESLANFIRGKSNNGSHILPVSLIHPPNTPLAISSSSKRAAPESPVDNESKAKQSRDHDSLVDIIDEEEFDLF